MFRTTYSLGGTVVTEFIVQQNSDNFVIQNSAE